MLFRAALLACLLPCAALAEVHEVRMLNRNDTGPMPFELIDGIACTQAQTTHDAPVTLVTEFPDETVHGDAFRFAHLVQMHTVLAAVQAWQQIEL